MNADRRLLYALLREDFTFFLRYGFKEVIGGSDYDHNWHIDAILYQLERIRQGDNNRLIVTLPPRNLKSFTITTAWVAWMLGKNPALKFMCVSYGQDLVDKHARDCLQIITSPWYKRAFPRVRLTKRSIADFETDMGGGRLSVSCSGPITGRGADIIVIDDPMKADEVLSPTHREATRTMMFNTLMQRLNSQEKGSIILVMQRLHVADLAGELIELGGWHELRLSALATADERVPVGPGQYHLRLAGEALHPALLSVKRLEEIKARDSYVFAAQFQQTPVPEQGNFVNPAWFQYYDAPPDRGMVVQSWDTASKNGLTNDYSVGITAVRYQGRYHVLHVHRERMDFVRLRQVVSELCQRFSVDRLLIEDTASGMQLLQMLRHDRPDHMPLPIACTPEGDKVTRFAAQASRIEAGELIFPRSAPWLAELEAELVGFPNTRHDDQADAVAQLLKHSPIDPEGPPVGGFTVSVDEDGNLTYLGDYDMTDDETDYDGEDDALY